VREGSSSIKSIKTGRGVLHNAGKKTEGPDREEETSCHQKGDVEEGGHGERLPQWDEVGCCGCERVVLRVQCWYAARFSGWIDGGSYLDGALLGI
jgi:hypothetical protein